LNTAASTRFNHSAFVGGAFVAVFAIGNHDRIVMPDGFARRPPIGVTLHSGSPRRGERLRRRRSDRESINLMTIGVAAVTRAAMA
jgi:hypothetical protein